MLGIYTRGVMVFALLLAAGCDSGTTFSVMDAGTINDAEAQDSGTALDSAMPEARSYARTLFTLLDFGHVDELVNASVAGDRVMTQDIRGRWNLWEVSTGSLVANGQTSRDSTYAHFTPTSRLRGSTLALENLTGTQIRNAEDGRLIAEIAARPWNLSEDGSYFWGNPGNHHLALWTASSGAALAGLDVDPAAVFAHASEMIVVTQPPESRIQHFPLGEQLPTVSNSYPGNFIVGSANSDTFLVDGPALDEGDQKFVGVCNLDGSLLGKVLQKPGAVLSASYRDLVMFTTDDPSDPAAYKTDVYRVATDQVFHLHGAPQRPEVAGLLAMQGSTLDLDKPNLQGFSDPAPIDRDRSTGFYVGIHEGMHAVVFSESGLRRAFGARPISAAGSASGRIAITTTDGLGRVYDLTMIPPRLVSSFSASGNVQLSADGQILLATAAVFNASNGTPVHTWNSDAFLQLSEDGSRLLSARCEGGQSTPRTCSTELAAPDGSVSFASPLPPNHEGGSFALSPDGKHTAWWTRDERRFEIYRDGQLSGQHTGLPLAWLDNEHILVADFESKHIHARYARDIVVDVAGNVTRSLGSGAANGTDDRRVVRINDDSFLMSALTYTGKLEVSIWSRAEDRSLWSPSRTVSSAYAAYGYPVVVGQYVVYQSGTQLIAESWR